MVIRHGGSLPGPGEGGNHEAVTRQEPLQLIGLLKQTAAAVVEEHGDELSQVSHLGLLRIGDQSDGQKRLTLAVISAQQKALLDARGMTGTSARTR